MMMMMIIMMMTMMIMYQLYAAEVWLAVAALDRQG